MLAQPRRNRWAALRFFRKLLHTAVRAPCVIITGKLWTYAAAKKLILLDVERRQSCYLNNRAGNSHQPTRM
ncbi:DDE-type integrase/transposase/recombinase [Tunturiibacter psychrotolerans]|uniref:DDE-type integrase/transposase/recombinase n=1 Tax=Tunturiibacter psychrotolerans TaxID=3069686 RepID=UPI00333F10DD